MKTTYLLRDQDDRVDGEGLTWWLHLGGDERGEPIVGDSRAERAELRGWWRMPPTFDPSTDEVSLVSKPTRRVTGYRRTRRVEGYPEEELTLADYASLMADADADEGDPVARLIYEPVWQDDPPAVTPLRREWQILDGAPPPRDDGLTWQATLPGALREREEYLHLFPGALLGYREAVAKALDALPDVRAYAASASPNVSVYLHVKLPRLERLEWQKSAFRPGMTRQERRKAQEWLAQTYEVVTRALEIPVVSRVTAENRATAVALWHEGIAEIVAYVESITGHLCPACQGRGYYEARQVEDEHGD